jgi:hypothetical protein
VNFPNGSDVHVSSFVAGLLEQTSLFPRRTSHITYPTVFSVLGRVITPFDPRTFDFFLKSLGLSKKFPDLVKRLSVGYPLGVEPERLTESIVPPIRKSEEDEAIIEYLREEIEALRMDGPYSRFQLEELMGGPFAACPVHVVVKTDEDGNQKRRVVRNISYRGEEGFSVNDLIDSDEWPTEWGTAARVAQIVSKVFTFF